MNAASHPAQSHLRRPPPRRWSSFSLVELLVVMAIIAILVAMAVPAMRSMLDSDNLSTGAQAVADQVNLARQISSSRNTTVELRFFRMSGDTTGGCTAVQLGTNSTAGLWQSVAHLVRMPQNITISTNTTLSPAFTGNAGTLMTNAGVTYNATYYPYEFRPSGIVTPVENMTNYCFMVLYARNSSASSITALTNYAIVQVNPVTSTPMVFRP
jgi:uncharacterized protein (TIGR02596 family)